MKSTISSHFIVVLALVAMAAAQNKKLSPELQNPAGGAVNVIVQFNAPPTARHHQKVLDRGGTLKQELGVVQAAAYSMPASAVADLANDPEVVYIASDLPLSGASNSTTPDYHTDTLNAPYAWGSDSMAQVSLWQSSIAELSMSLTCTATVPESFTARTSWAMVREAPTTSTAMAATSPHYRRKRQEIFQPE